MRLTRLDLHEFRRFAALHLEPVDPGHTIIVGPNGSGKSSLFQALRMVQLALTWAGQYSSEAYAGLQRYEAALRRRSTSRRLMARVGIELTELWEQNLILEFVRALCASTLADRNPPVDALGLARFLESVNIESVKPILSGDVVVAFSRKPSATWMVAYEFQTGGRNYHFALQGGPVGHIMAGRLPDQSRSGWRSADLPTRLVACIHKEEPFSFELLLPEGDEGTPAQVKGNAAYRSSVVGDFIGLIGSTADAGREHSLGQLLDLAFNTSLALISDQRLPPRIDYALTDLTHRPNLIDGANVPLELYRLKNGDLNQRRRFAEIQALFQRLTGNSVELVVRSTDQGSQSIAIEPTVIEDASWEVSIGLAGAGAWEALILATILCGDAGMVAALDEPAVNLAPALQRRLADELERREGTQVLLITHSPYLVGIRRVRDLRRIVRVSIDSSGTSQIRRLKVDGAAGLEGLESQWRQLLAGRADVRSALFASGVVLVEGETEFGAFDKWFEDASVTAGSHRSPESLNLQILSVGGDQVFGPYIAYLEACGIPWAVICDGPVLSPNYRGGTPLVDQFKLVGLSSVLTEVPNTDASFEEWRLFWAKHRIHTLAEQFGGLDADSKDRSGEIEYFFESTDSTNWLEAKAKYPKSKVRAGHAFAELVPCPTAVKDLYGHLVSELI